MLLVDYLIRLSKMRSLSYLFKRDIENIENKEEIDTISIETTNPDVKILRKFTSLKKLVCRMAVCVLTYIRTLDIEMNRQQMVDRAAHVIRRMELLENLTVRFVRYHDHLDATELAGAVSTHGSLGSVDILGCDHAQDDSGLLNSLCQNKRITSIGVCLTSNFVDLVHEFKHVISLRIRSRLERLKLLHDLLVYLAKHGNLRRFMSSFISTGTLERILSTTSHIEYIEVESIYRVYDGKPFHQIIDMVRDSNVILMKYDNRKYRSLRSIGYDTRALQIIRDQYIDTVVYIA